MIEALGQIDWQMTAGTWVGFGVSLLILSSILGDHWLARLGNHVLVGAALGYAAVVTWHALMNLPLVHDLVANPVALSWNWIPVALAILLTAASLERIFWQGESGPPRHGWHRVVRWLGMGPAALLVSAGMAIAGLGVVQGTLGPQFLHTAQTGADWQAPWGVFLTGLLAMLLTASCAHLLRGRSAPPPGRSTRLGAALYARLDLGRPARRMACRRRGLCAPDCLAHQPDVCRN